MSLDGNCLYQIVGAMMIMIVSESEHHYRLITQTDHADLAGQFADHWGNDEFEHPNPYSAMVLTAYNHDDGWWEYDRRPHRSADGEIIDFTAIPAETWIDLYDDGIDTVAKTDSYAGLLVSMHGSGLRRQRYGLSSSMPASQPEYTDFIDRQERVQDQLVTELCETDRYSQTSENDTSFLEALHDTGRAPEGYNGRLWFNYKLLQAWDTLSLSFCMTESPPSSDEIDAVPTAAGAADETLTIALLGKEEFRVEPYPFDSSPLVVRVPARTVPKDADGTDEDLIQAYYGSEREMREFALRRSA